MLNGTKTVIKRKIGLLNLAEVEKRSHRKRRAKPA